MKLQKITESKRKRGSKFTMVIDFTPADAKKFLQQHFRKMKRMDLPNCFFEGELVALFADERFSFMDKEHAQQAAKWCVKVAILYGYVTTNVWDRNIQTVYFIPDSILEIRPGPKEAHSADRIYRNELQRRKDIARKFAELNREEEKK